MIVVVAWGLCILATAITWAVVLLLVHGAGVRWWPLAFVFRSLGALALWFGFSWGVTV